MSNPIVINPAETINLEQWVNASIDQRSAWLKERIQLDSLSQRILHWCLSFRSVGASIDDSHMVRLFKSANEERG